MRLQLCSFDFQLKMDTRDLARGLSRGTGCRTSKNDSTAPFWGCFVMGSWDERRWGFLTHVEDKDWISTLFMKGFPPFMGLMMKSFCFLIRKTRRWDLGIFNGENKSDFW